MNNEITLLFAGDFIPPVTNESAFTADLQEVLKDKDFSIVNLETPLTGGGAPILKTGNNFRRPKDTAIHISNGFFDAVTLSNNHIRDFGSIGVVDTIKTCEKYRIRTVGAGENISVASIPLHLNLKGKKICILNYSEIELNHATSHRAGANPFDLITAFEEIKKQKEINDIVIVIYHGGLEYHHLPLPEIKRRFRFLLENGADAIISHHTHYISGFSLSNEKPAFYGLGNFYIKYKSKKLIENRQLHQGLIIKLLIRQDNDIKFEIIPVKKSADQSMLDLMTQSENADLLKRIEGYSQMIENNAEHSNYWKEQSSIYLNKYRFSIKYSNNLLIKFLRRINRFIPLPLNDKWKTRILNLHSCTSHNEMIINCFSQEAQINK